MNLNPFAKKIEAVETNPKEMPKDDMFITGARARNSETSMLLMVTNVEDGIVYFTEQYEGETYNPLTQRDPNVEIKKMNINDWKEFLIQEGYMH